MDADELRSIPLFSELTDGQRALTMPVWDFSDGMREVPELGNRVRQRVAEHLERE